MSDCALNVRMFAKRLDWTARRARAARRSQAVQIYPNRRALTGVAPRASLLVAEARTEKLAREKSSEPCTPSPWPAMSEEDAAAEIKPNRCALGRGAPHSEE